MANWIWFPGDFELYHSLLLHSRRQLRQMGYPCFWDMSVPYANVMFFKRFYCPVETKIKAVSHSAGALLIDWRFNPLNCEISVPAGEHTAHIKLINPCGGIPSVFIDSEFLKTDNTWSVSHNTTESFPAADTPHFISPDDNPEVFPFTYERVDFVSEEKKDGGTLYDFGKELFASVIISHDASANTELGLVYGESPEEACDEKDAIITDTLYGSRGYSLPPRAFRCLFVKAPESVTIKLHALDELLPLDEIGSFSCDRGEVDDIYKVCVRTLRLCSREFFLDGIKRDRWLWSGDAYQSFMTNNYIFADREITKRSIRAMLGRPPYSQHINTINDYSMYLIISVEDYFNATADIDFVKEVYPSVKALYEFILGRTDSEGLVCPRPGDWIFVDWSEMDKSGCICAEQILLWKAMKSFAALSEVVGMKLAGAGTCYEAFSASEKLRRKIMRLYWSDEKHAFLENPEAESPNGRHSVKRHANIFAVMYDFVEADKKKDIFEYVLENDGVTQITTPYFKFFELIAFCKEGRLEYAQKLIESYWGGMVRLGATSIWERFDPNEEGPAHLAMYGQKYGCSLCHAWGSGPVYLLGRYCLGVYPTSPGFATFVCEPKAGVYKSFRGTVPINGGVCRVEYREDGSVYVTATRPGGTLRVNGVETPIPVVSSDS